MNSKIILLSLIGFISIGTIAQTKKNYIGVFKTANFNGSATYQYSETINGERIFDGSFRFSANNNAVTIVGLFKNNLKTGTWKYSLINYSFSDLMAKYNITCTSTGNYSEGKLQGPWKLQKVTTISHANNGISQYYKSQLNSLSVLLTNKNIDYSQKQNVIETSNVCFENNHFIGNFFFSINDGKSKVSGQFDNEGYLDGVWIISYYSNGVPMEERRTYLSGVLVKIKTKDLSTGELTTSSDNEINVIEFFKNYNKRTNISTFNEKAYKLKSIKPNEERSLFDRSLCIWINNVSRTNTAFAYEIKQGRIIMDKFPIRTIIELDINKLKESLQDSIESN